VKFLKFALRQLKGMLDPTRLTTTTTTLVFIAAMVLTLLSTLVVRNFSSDRQLTAEMQMLVSVFYLLLSNG